MSIHIPDGTFNFRDLGGRSTANGGRVRTGLLYRSGELDGLTPAGWQHLADLRIAGIYDLRGNSEITIRAPGAIGPSVTVRHRGEPADIQPPLRMIGVKAFGKSNRRFDP
jgi:hypothetical protein